MVDAGNGMYGHLGQSDFVRLTTLKPRIVHTPERDEGNFAPFKSITKGTNKWYGNSPTCINSGWEAYCCPFLCAYHTVSFDDEEAK
jgi:hypothetical protein